MPENLNLNLLPQNLQVSKGLGKVLKTAKALGVILVVAFVVFCLGIVALFIINKTTLTNTQASVDQLKTQVKAQETSEQQLILLKDRLAKIASIKSTPNASKSITNVDSLFANVSSASTMNEANITSSKMDISLIISSNDDLTSFIQNIKSTKLFNTINLPSFTYSANNGYSIAVSLTNK